MNFYEFYSNKRIYTPLKGVSKKYAGNIVPLKVMESHTCFDTIELHDAKATAETVFAIIKTNDI